MRALVIERRQTLLIMRPGTEDIMECGWNRWDEVGVRILMVRERIGTLCDVHFICYNSLDYLLQV